MGFRGQFNSTTLSNRSQNGAGTITGATAAEFWGGGKHGVTFDGSNDYVDLDAHIAQVASATVGTIAAWFKTSNTGSSRIIAASTDLSTTTSVVALYQESVSDHIKFFVRASGTYVLRLETPLAYNDNEWHHVAIAVGSSGNALYIDGAAITPTYTNGNASTQKWFADVSGLDSLRVGDYELSTGNALFWDGDLDDIRIYNRALSAAEVGQLYNVTSRNYKTPTDPPPAAIGWWKLDETTGTTAADSSGNSYDGTLTGGLDFGTDSTSAKGGILGTALTFDGVGDYIDLDTHVSNFASDTVGTMAGWVKTTHTGSDKVILCATDKGDAVGSQLILHYTSSLGNGLRLAIAEGGVVSVAADTTETINTGSWVHCAVTMGSGGSAFYIDGVAVTPTYTVGTASTQAWFNTVTNLDALRIGNRETSGGNDLHWSGDLDDVRIYNVALTAAQVKQLYDMGQ